MFSISSRKNSIDRKITFSSKKAIPQCTGQADQRLGRADQRSGRTDQRLGWADQRKGQANQYTGKRINKQAGRSV